MDKVFNDEQIGHMLTRIDYLKVAVHNEFDRNILCEIENILREDGMDADDWAIEAGYGFCDYCSGEMFRDESRD